MGKSFQDHSRVNWEPADTPAGNYPGHERVRIGCLQRIATATELIAQKYADLERERDKYKRWYEEERASGQRLVRSNNALRGVINRMKKNKKP